MLQKVAEEEIKQNDIPIPFLSLHQHHLVPQKKVKIKAYGYVRFHVSIIYIIIEFVFYKLLEELKFFLVWRKETSFTVREIDML